MNEDDKRPPTSSPKFQAGDTVVCALVGSIHHGDRLRIVERVQGPGGDAGIWWDTEDMLGRSTAAFAESMLRFEGETLAPLESIERKPMQPPVKAPLDRKDINPNARPMITYAELWSVLDENADLKAANASVQEENRKFFRRNNDLSDAAGEEKTRRVRAEEEITMLLAENATLRRELERLKKVRHGR